MNDDHYAKYHSLDSAPAYFLVLARLVLLGVFLVGAFKTFEAEANAVRRGFIGRLILLGSAWFAAMPLLVLVAMVCAEYVREPVSGDGSVIGAGAAAVRAQVGDLFRPLAGNTSPWLSRPRSRLAILLKGCDLPPGEVDFSTG